MPKGRLITLSRLGALVKRAVFRPSSGRAAAGRRDTAWLAGGAAGGDLLSLQPVPQ